MYKRQQVAELERQKEENLQVKLSIIEELKELVESGDDANKSYTEFKKLQQQWNDTKLVPQGKVNELWKNYQLYVEKFYDLLKLNNEFREYDFKKMCIRDSSKPAWITFTAGSTPNCCL